MTLSGALIQCAPWPIAVSPDGLCADSDDADHFWTFESIRSISSHERTIRINGAAAIQAQSAVLAIDLSRHLEELRGMPAATRADAIRSALGRSFDPDLVRAAWSRFRKASRALTILAALPLAWLTVVTPLALILAGPLASWPFLLGGLILAGLAASIEFVRVHRRELPGVPDRWLHAVSMTLFPIAAIRAADRISKEKVALFNPLAVVAVFCDDAGGDSILRRLGFDLERGTAAHAGAPAAACREWYHEQKRSAFKGLLKAVGRNPLGAPERADDGMAAYCPRCHAQFQQGTDQCSDCVDATLVTFVKPDERADRGTRKRTRAVTS
jgi:hypothetical protein